MKKFIHFPELLGSDSFNHVDGRLSEQKLIEEAHAIAHDKRFVQPRITRACIWAGSISDGKAIKAFPIERKLYAYAVYCELSKDLDLVELPIEPNEVHKFFPPYQQWQHIL